MQARSDRYFADQTGRDRYQGVEAQLTLANPFLLGDIEPVLRAHQRRLNSCLRISRQFARPQSVLADATLSRGANAAPSKERNDHSDNRRCVLSG